MLMNKWRPITMDSILTIYRNISNWEICLDALLTITKIKKEKF